MARVPKQSAASVGTGADRHKKAEQKKASYKVTYEEISQKKKLKHYRTSNTIAPPGYLFIPAGDPQVTKRCKKIALEEGLTVYIVSAGEGSHVLSHEVNRLGYHFPTVVVQRACQSLGVQLNDFGRVTQSHLATVEERMAQFLPSQRRKTKKKAKARGGRDSPKFDLSLSQAVIDTQAREAIIDLFPKIPRDDLHAVISRAFQKGMGLIGTAAGTSLARRAQLAVVAHIRHTYTEYDKIINGIGKPTARLRVEQNTLDKLLSWREDDDEDTDLMEDILKEVIVISDDEDDNDQDPNGATAVQNSYSQNLNVRAAPLGDLPTRPITLTDDSSADSDEDDGIPSRGPRQVFHRLPGETHQYKEDGLGAQRHRRWEEALDRRRKNPHAPHDRFGQVQDGSHPMHPLPQRQIPNSFGTTPEQDYSPPPATASILSSLREQPRPQSSTTGWQSNHMPESSRSDGNAGSSGVDQVARTHNPPPESWSREIPLRPHYEPNAQCPGKPNAIENRQALVTDQAEQPRFAEAQHPPRKFNDARDFRNPQSLPPGQPENILPSVKGVAPTNQPYPMHGHLQHRRPFVIRNNEHDAFQNPSPPVAYFDMHEELTSPKRRRVDGPVLTPLEQAQQPLHSYGKARTVLIPLDHDDRQSETRVGPVGPAFDISERAVMWAPKEGTIATPKTPRQIRLVQNATHQENRRPSSEGYGVNETGGRFQVPLSESDSKRTSHFLSSASQNPRSVHHQSSSFDDPRVVPVSAISDSRVPVRHERVRSTGSRVALPYTEPLQSSVQRLVGLEKVAHPQYKDMSTDQRRPEDYNVSEREALRERPLIYELPRHFKVERHKSPRLLGKDSVRNILDMNEVHYDQYSQQPQQGSHDVGQTESRHAPLDRRQSGACRADTFENGAAGTRDMRVLDDGDAYVQKPSQPHHVRYGSRESRGKEISTALDNPAPPKRRYDEYGPSGRRLPQQIIILD